MLFVLIYILFRYFYILGWFAKLNCLDGGNSFDVSQPYLSVCVLNEIDNDWFDPNALIYLLYEYDQSTNHVFYILSSDWRYLLVEDIALAIFVQLDQVSTVQVL